MFLQKKQNDMMKKFLAIIPARGGSKGVPRKNIKPIAGKPLIAYTIEEAKKCALIDRIVVSTEDEEIASISKRYGAEVIKRPYELAQDDTSTNPVLTHVVEELEKNEGYCPDYILLIPATSPLRKKEHIEEAIKKLLAEGADSLLSVSFIYKHRYDILENGTIVPVVKERKNRQERKPVVVENGVLYISAINLIKSGKIIGENISYYPMDSRSSVNIDEPMDFFIAEQLIINEKGYENGEKNY